MRISRSIVVAVCVVTCWSAASSVRAATTTNNPALPPDTGQYEGNHFTYNGPGLTVVVQDIRFDPQPELFVSRAPSGPDEIETFTSMLSGNGSVNGGPFVPISSSGQSRMDHFGKIGNPTGTFNAEMLSMDLSGVSPFGPFMIRESPTLASNGQTTITDLGGGLFRIDSFFDVFTELSIDGGATWIPQSDGPTRITLTPEPATVGILLLAGAAACARRRRR